MKLSTPREGRLNLVTITCANSATMAILVSSQINGSVVAERAGGPRGPSAVAHADQPPKASDAAKHHEGQPGRHVERQRVERGKSHGRSGDRGGKRLGQIACLQVAAEPP